MTSTISRDERLEPDDRQAPFNAAVDALLDAAGGWRLTATKRHGRMPESDDRAAAVQKLLDELCTDLGFCLPAKEQERLRRSPALEPDEFTDAVFIAEGLQPGHYRHLRRQVRDRVERRLPGR